MTEPLSPASRQLLREMHPCDDLDNAHSTPGGTWHMSRNRMESFLASIEQQAAARQPDYEERVRAMADALHEDCRLEWQAIAVVDPTRMLTQHMADAHYGQAHDLVRRLRAPSGTPEVGYEPERAEGTGS